MTRVASPISVSMVRATVPWSSNAAIVDSAIVLIVPGPMRLST
jgi:hypothetical protein